jgi:antitoxin (DNA-binding transcriptional repressor) of toxin-antitoxin stability system
MLQARFCRNGPFEPPFLHPEAAVITPKVRLGAGYVPDFVIELRRRRYIFVEVEHPQHQVITRNGRPSAKLTAANQQVEDWFRWTSDNIAYARTILPDISEPSGKVILGWDAGTPPQHREVLRRRNAEYHRIESMTFDDLLENAEQHLSNLRHM